MESRLDMSVSWIALVVKYIPIASMTTEEANAPTQALTLPSLASFTPTMSTM